jgi:hypothetical protein
MERGEEISRCLILARSDAAELFELAEENLSQVACVVEWPACCALNARDGACRSEAVAGAGC